MLDLDAEWKVEPLRFQSKSRNTPFAGYTGKGAPAMTIVGGKVIRLPPPPAR